MNVRNTVFEQNSRVDLCALLRKVNLDQEAHRAATSLLNLRSQPTENQRKAGNYKKGHVQFAGLSVAIENPAGSYRRPEWPPMQSHYGYVKGTEGKDGDSVDVFLKPSTPVDWDGTAYVINQDDQKGKFDEHKVMLGYDDERSAVNAYLAHYPKDWKLGSVVAMSLDELKVWLEHGDTTRSLAKRDWDESLHPRDEDGRFGYGTGGYSNKDGQWYQNGKPVSAEIQKRLKELAVPPGWSNVSLNPDSKAALQVVGKDSKGRTVYIRSAEKDAQAAAEKFARLQEFNKIAAGVKEEAVKDMQSTTLSQKERDTAAALALIAHTGFRPGSDKDTGAAKQAYGATTLLGSHVTVRGDTLKFNFTGKKGVDISHEVVNKALARYIEERKAENGDGRLFTTSDSDLREYFHAKAGDDFKVKDFRTWNGTTLALREVEKLPAPTSKTAYMKMRAAVGDKVSSFLGNTRSVALSSYIHPAVFSKWEANFQ